MDVVFLITSLGRGGAETQLARLAEGLAGRGWKVGILTMLPSRESTARLEAAGVCIVACPDARRRPWRTAAAILRHLRAWRPPLLVTFNFPADVMGRVCGRLAGVPHNISSLRTAHLKSTWRKWFYRLTRPWVRLTVSNSKAALALMLRNRLMRPQDMVVIPNGMDTSAYPDPVAREVVRAELGLAEAAFAWVAVGNLRPAKDYPNLLAAAAACAAAYPDFRLLIAGGGELLAPLQAQALALGLQGKVVFLGSREDVPRLLVAADAFVLSSAWEGMPNTVMEALASGLPVVATDAGDVRELVEEGRSGFVVPTGDPGLLAERMEGMMALPAKERQAMGQHGRRRMVSDYDMDRILERWIQVFEAHGLRPPGLQ